MDKGHAALEEGSPVLGLAQKDNLPCCTFVACWLLQVSGRVPEAPDNWKSWYRLDPKWWERAKVWDPHDLWSALPAAQDLIGGVLAKMKRVGPEQSAPPLTHGKWHVIQRWRGKSGHTYLAYAGDTIQIVQSSESKGYRNTDGGSWGGTAGLDGYDVGVLTLDLE